MKNGAWKKTALALLMVTATSAGWIACNKNGGGAEGGEGADPPGTIRVT
jgi:hypothetical protein